MKATSSTKKKGVELSIDPDTGLSIETLKREIEKGVLSGASEMDLIELREHIKKEARQHQKQHNPKD